MKDWTWKNWLGIAAVLFSTWLIFYVAEWNSRNSAGTPHGDAIIGWLGDVVMLQWVKNYQTLLAGLLAFGAGAFVYLTAKMQRQDALADRNQAIRDHRLGRLKEARRLLFGLATNGAYLFKSPSLMPRSMDNSTAVLDRVSEGLMELRPVIAEIGPFASQLANALTQISERVQLAVAKAKEPSSWGGDRVDVVVTLSLAGYAANFLNDEDRLIDRIGNYGHQRLPWDEANGKLDPILSILYAKT